MARMGLSVERQLAREESMRLPYLIRYPKLIKRGTAMSLRLTLLPGCYRFLA
jgi:hypothetical protein